MTPHEIIMCFPPLCSYMESDDSFWPMGYEGMWYGLLFSSDHGNCILALRCSNLEAA